jgi:hypothetical protein
MVPARPDKTLRQEARRLRLCWSCDVCAHFDPERERCVHGYPTEPHRAAALEAQDEMAFCKEFELS